ncbi:MULTISPECIES: hypothetical protein [unclassified Microcoleus]
MAGTTFEIRGHRRNWHMVMSAIAPRTGRIQVRSPPLKLKGDRD